MPNETQHKFKVGGIEVTTQMKDSDKWIIISRYERFTSSIIAMREEELREIAETATALFYADGNPLEIF